MWDDKSLSSVGWIAEILPSGFVCRSSHKNVVSCTRDVYLYEEESHFPFGLCDENRHKVGLRTSTGKFWVLHGPDLINIYTKCRGQLNVNESFLRS